MDIAFPVKQEITMIKAQKEGKSERIRRSWKKLLDVDRQNPKQVGSQYPLPNNAGKKLILFKPLLPQMMAPNRIHTLPRRKRKKALGFNRPQLLHKQAHTLFN
jgi:hypothetical protein